MAAGGTAFQTVQAEQSDEMAGCFVNRYKIYGNETKEKTEMAGRSGRPKKADKQDSRQIIIDTTIGLVRTIGADALTVRKVCSKAGLSIGTFYHFFQNKDDLMMYFIRETSFAELELHTPPDHFSDRIAELYMHLFDKYMEFGVDFMRKFYTPENSALQLYMGTPEGTFADGTVMHRCEEEIRNAQKLGILTNEANAHILSIDICTVVKGCIFEWALDNGEMDIEAAFRRLFRLVLKEYLDNSL